MTVFWRKYNELCDERGIKPRTLATELGISAATVTKWVNDGMPNLEMITRIAEYFDVPIDYLINEDDTDHLKDTETIFDILGILDHCADTESYRIVQVQLSRIVLYHLKEKGFDREALRTEHLDQEKMEYLYTGKDSGKTHNYGLNFSDMDFLREFTGLSYQVMFTGVE